MVDLEAVYNDRFFRTRDALSWRKDYVCPAIINSYLKFTGEPLKSLVDVGCGLGYYVEEFCRLGLNACGIEGSKRAIPYLMTMKSLVYIHDLRKPLVISTGTFFKYERKKDLVMCFEVAEHIEHDFATMFVYNLIQLSDNVLISAAPPGQGGVGHVNCRDKEYWIELFDTFNFTENKEMVNLVKSEWNPIKHKKIMGAYYRNLMFFQRK